MSLDGAAFRIREREMIRKDIVQAYGGSRSFPKETGQARISRSAALRWEPQMQAFGRETKRSIDCGRERKRRGLSFHNDYQRAA